MDATEIFKHEGRRFLCSGEQLPSGSFQAVVRSKLPPDDLLCTLVFGPGHYATGQQALIRAKELAEEWSRTHPDHEQI
ncbi:MAG: hypothetical protein EOP02_29195 [Proteobacteria bacterium]|nr:MAG: hypothetical protein EOP02_29195 [Pseudomonadota bacterium]